MPLEIHALMQDADYKQFVLRIFVKDNMRLLADAAQSRRHVFRAAAKLRIVELGQETAAKLVPIKPRLIDAEFVYGVIGYFGQITCGLPA
ncbi:hypothetical protein AZE99_03805 [Sphingorhabdus sp. M41]|nr:hypothetical protein [Sphingorhabdus sp. M41]AMO71103.1 hypothetical protein AZE99_03805 [Sphingorhabdus sp. M41]